MKKLLCIIFAVMMLITFMGCELDTTLSNEGDAIQQNPLTKNETFGLNETAVFKSLKITASEIKESHGGLFLGAEDGYVYVGIRFIIENISDEYQTIDSFLLFDAYADDVKCSVSFTADTAFDGGTLDGTIAPKKKLVGWYALEVPDDWSVIELNVEGKWLSGGSAKFVFTK